MRQVTFIPRFLHSPSETPPKHTFCCFLRSLHITLPCPMTPSWERRTGLRADEGGETRGTAAPHPGAAARHPRAGRALGGAPGAPSSRRTGAQTRLQ